MLMRAAALALLAGAGAKTARQHFRQLSADGPCHEATLAYFRGHARAHWGSRVDAALGHRAGASSRRDLFFKRNLTHLNGGMSRAAVLRRLQGAHVVAGPGK